MADTIYRSIPQKDRRISVEMTKPNGRRRVIPDFVDEAEVFVMDIASTSGRRSVRRFPTEAAALTWIAEQEFGDVAAETAMGADVNQSSASLS